ncbi:MAG: carbohydrate porin [Caulobacterales bacterium]
MQNSGKLAAAAAAVVAAATPAFAQTPLATVSAEYTAEVIGPVDGASTQRGRFLDNLSIEAGLNLERAIGWQGAALNLHLLNNSGGEPNQDVGSLEGVSNIEVARHRAKVFEFWLEQQAGRHNFVVGFYDLNRDFYATESAGLLLAPPFGIGSEIAATGTNGPSIFPSSALGARWHVAPSSSTYVQTAVFDASAGVLGDPDDISGSFENGALLIGEAGITKSGKLALGLWSSTQAQPDIRDLTSTGDPADADARGAYLLAEHDVLDRAPGTITAFVRAGLSDGDTTDFEGGWQTGFNWSGFSASRPDAVAALGLRHGAISPKARDNMRDAGMDPSTGEYGLELTFADQITPWLSVQPDLQLIWNPGADDQADTITVLGVRAAIALDRTWD